VTEKSGRDDVLWSTEPASNAVAAAAAADAQQAASAAAAQQAFKSGKLAFGFSAGGLLFPVSYAAARQGGACCAAAKV
jgi:hypothetical protein